MEWKLLGWMKFYLFGEYFVFDINQTWKCGWYAPASSEENLGKMWLCDNTWHQPVFNSDFELPNQQKLLRGLTCGQFCAQKIIGQFGEPSAKPAVY